MGSLSSFGTKMKMVPGTAECVVKLTGTIDPNVEQVHLSYYRACFGGAVTKAADHLKRAAASLKSNSEPRKWQLVEKLPTGTVQLGCDLTPLQRLYRYMPLARAEQLFETSKLRFANPEGWLDPYEKWWCDKLFAPGCQLAGANAFACCWTTATSDEPYWRMYDHEKGKIVDAVRLSTTVGKLVRVLKQHIENAECKAFIARVKYRDVAVLKLAAETRLIGPKAGLAITAANALIYKRAPFWFEQEVRAIVVDRHGHADARFLDVSPLDLVDSIMIGPSTKADRAEEIALKFAAMGFAKSSVKQSSFYKVPRL